MADDREKQRLDEALRKAEVVRQRDEARDLLALARSIQAIHRKQQTAVEPPSPTRAEETGG